MKTLLLLAALAALAAPLAAHAQLLTNPAPVRTTPPGAIVFTKELGGYPNYGTSDGAADILYTGNTGAWTFDVPVADLAAATGAPFFTARLVLDDHYGVSEAAYAFAATVNGIPVPTGTPALSHGAPFDAQFANWLDINLPAGTLTAGVNTLSLANTSVGTGATDWIAVDRLRLTLPTVAVPEAGSLALLSPALLVGAIVRRRILSRKDN